MASRSLEMHASHQKRAECPGGGEFACRLASPVPTCRGRSRKKRFMFVTTSPISSVLPRRRNSYAASEDAIGASHFECKNIIEFHFPGMAERTSRRLRNARLA